MPTVFDVAAFVLGRTGDTTATRLQGLVYYSQAWSVAWGHGALFGESIEAWDQGPVVRLLWEARRGARCVDVADLAGMGDPTALSSDQCDDIDAVLQVYGRFTPEELSDMTHHEEPWVRAYQWRMTITPAMLGRYYREVDVTREPSKAEGAFLLKTLLAKVTPQNQHEVLDWGDHVGQEQEPW